MGLSMKKFSLIDYIIIILVICAVIFAFIHITTDDSNHLEKTAFDASTINKIPDTYFSNYKEGNIVWAYVDGLNASNSEEVSLNGTVKWIDDNGGSNIKILLDSNNQTYLLGVYKSIPEADVYIDTITLESNNTKYDNLVEFKIKPKNITSLDDLVSKIPENTDYELTTKIATDSIDYLKIQEINNELNARDKRSSIATSNVLENQLILTRANDENIKIGNSILGNFNGITDDITIRIYDCSDSQLNAIKNNYDVMNIQKFK